MSLHYPVKLEILITQVLPLRCHRKELQNLSHLNCSLQIRDFNPVDYSVWEHCKRRCKNTHDWSGWTETATENGVDQAGSCHHCGSHSSVASLIASDQWCVFCTPLLQYFPHAVINGFKSGKFQSHSSSGINSGVSLANNSIVAHAQRAFFPGHSVCLRLTATHIPANLTSVSNQQFPVLHRQTNWHTYRHR